MAWLLAVVLRRVCDLILCKLFSQLAGSLSSNVLIWDSNKFSEMTREPEETGTSIELELGRVVAYEPLRLENRGGTPRVALKISSSSLAKKKYYAV